MSALPTHWLLLRGLGRQAQHWFRFPTVLERRLSVRAHCLDLPGTGRARSLPVPWDVPSSARVICEQFDALPIAGAAAGVIGLSLGGMVALSACALRPDRFSHLVLINSSSRLSPWYRRLRPEGVSLVTRGLRTSDPFERERLIYRFTTGLGPTEVDRCAALAAAFHRAAPPRRRVIGRQLAAAARYHPPAVRQPVLVLSSARDRLVSPRCSADLARWLGAEHHQHPSAGHDLPLEDAGWVVDRIERWLGG